MARKLSPWILLLAVFASDRSMAQSNPTHGRIIFGDSISDTGNVYRVTGQPPVIGGPASSDAGRYSNGPMWVDLFAPGYAFYSPTLFGEPYKSGTTSVNFAVGGSQSCGLPSCTGVSGAQAFSMGIAPGALVQINDYLSSVKSGALPAITQATQFFIFSGGNDYSPYAATAGSAASVAGQQTLVSKVIGNINTGISQLAAAGARQIVVFNQFDIGLVPQFRDPNLAVGLPANAAQVATDISNLHNAQLPGKLKEVAAATGASVIQIDVNRLYRDQFNNPGVWNLTNVTGTCVAGDFTTPTGLCNTKAQADQLMFWQPTHPSAATHAHIAALVDGTLYTVNYAPSAIAVQSQLAMRSAEAKAELVSDRLDGLFKQGRAVFMDGANDDDRRGAESGRGGYQYTVRQASLGLSQPMSQTTLAGLTASFGTSGATLDNGAGTLEATTQGLGAFFAMRHEAWTTLVEANTLRINFTKIDRSSGFSYFPNARGRSDATLWSLGASSRYRVAMGGFDLSPQMGVQYQNVNVDGYREDGSRLLDLDVASHGLHSTVATVGVRLDSSFALSGMTVLPQLDLDFQSELTQDGENIVASLADGQDVNGSSGIGPRNAVKLKAAIGVQFSGGTRLIAQLQRRFVDGGNSGTVAHVTLTHPF